MPRRLSIRDGLDPAVEVTRHALRARKLVYIIRARRRHKYAKGKSRVVYVGTTQRGVARIMESAATKASVLLTRHGIERMEIFIVTATQRQHVPTWKKLERALILEFKEMFGEPPLENKQGKRMVWRDEKKYFRRERLQDVIRGYS